MGEYFNLLESVFRNPQLYVSSLPEWSRTLQKLPGERL